MKLRIGYKDGEKVVFHLRVINIEEEESYNERFLSISDGEEMKYQKTFEICKEALGEFSEDMPQREIKEDGVMKLVPLVEDAKSPADAINLYFASRDAKSERLIRDSWLLFKRNLSPTYDFL